jgi:hypothetical protein
MGQISVAIIWLHFNYRSLPSSSIARAMYRSSLKHKQHSLPAEYVHQDLEFIIFCGSRDLVTKLYCTKMGTTSSTYTPTVRRRLHHSTSARRNLGPLYVPEY